MAGATKFYAWATPAFFNGAPVDHTWVTTYDNHQHTYANEAAVAAAKRDYWFCWGSYHPSGTAIGNQGGSLSLARCLVLSNADCNIAPAARGTIFIYGVDGVCHQLANQVLYATGPSPLKVTQANGYMASTFLYGDYGHRHTAWANKIQSCSAATTGAGGPTGGAVAGGASPGASPPGGGAAANPANLAGVLKMQDSTDDFEAHARSMLSNEPELLSKLLALRSDVHNFTAQAIPGFAPPDADTLNARNQHLIDQAALLLGPDKFKLIFGFPPDQKINLVDPSVTSP